MSSIHISIWLLSLCTLAFCYIFVLPYFTSPLRSIPGPFLTKFSNLWRLLATYGGRPELEHRRLHEQYGPVVRLGPNCVSLSDPSLVKTIYNAKGDFIKSQFYSVNDVMVGRATVATIFGTRSNAHHASQQRLVHKCYRLPNIKEFESHVDHIIEKFQTRLAEECIHSTGSGLCKMDEWINYYAWDVNGQISFSKPFGFLDAGNDFNGMLRTSERALDYFAVVGQIPWLDKVFDKNPIMRIGPPSFSAAAGFCASQTVNRQNELEKNGHDAPRQKDFLDDFLGIKEEHPGKVGLNDMVSFLLINILAGADTTVATLCAIIYYVLKNPRVHKKLLTELDTSGLNPPISYDDAVKLPYLMAVIRESMRMHPGVGLPLERIVPSSGLKTPNGTTLPSGTIVGMSAWVVHMNKTVFGQDAASFVPERWLQYQDIETEDEFKARLQNMNAVDLTFGGGKRICLGKHVALLQIYKLIPTMFLKYDMRFVNPNEEWKIQNSWFVRQTGMNLKIQLREPEKND